METFMIFKIILQLLFVAIPFIALVLRFKMIITFYEDCENLFTKHIINNTTFSKTIIDGVGKEFRKKRPSPFALFFSLRPIDIQFWYTDEDRELFFTPFNKSTTLHA